ncbi:hypothetical protein CCHR01_19834 [Colletotrichum chrysophilum]|uniref:Uncharacterized protein n=1 Tax=Colletotrichum chrysophilum TaxID=1836956 RepID=A0AAD8ZXK6_9PEZI|nr:hypothetical protein CCHR01_19834 [Colletotrichum chrysophilum]
MVAAPAAATTATTAPTPAPAACICTSSHLYWSRSYKCYSACLTLRPTFRLTQRPDGIIWDVGSGTLRTQAPDSYLNLHLDSVRPGHPVCATPRLTSAVLPC